MTPPCIIVDTREQCPLIFSRLASEVGTLTTADYSIKGMESAFAVERKSIPDLLQSLSGERERFLKEIDRMRGFDFARLLIVGRHEDVANGHYQSKMMPAAVLGSLAGIEARGIPIVWSSTADRAAELVERWVCYFVREKMKPFYPASELKQVVGLLSQGQPF